MKEDIAPKISVIIVNWNGYVDTSELLDSLKKVKSPTFNIIVVDNNSSGDDVKKLELNYAGIIKILECDDNLGFAGGNNVGIKQALKDGAEYILLLNNDTIVEENFLDKLLMKFQSIDNAGIVAPFINYYNEPDRIWSAGGKISKIRGSGFADSNELESKIKQIDKDVTFVSGCCMLVKREVFEAAGLFDEKFFLYIEDTDFCYRVVKTGYRILISNRSKIFHKVGVSTNNSNPIMPLYYATRNRLFFSKKHFSALFLIPLSYILISMSFKIIFWVFTGKRMNIIAVQKAFGDFFVGKMGRQEIIFN